MFSSNVSLSFQSTHPSGVRPCPYTPRTPARHISIHAPQWGATHAGRHGGGSRSNFNPRTPVGCDSRNRRLKQDKRFQSTHPSGVRRRFHLLPKPRGNFNPRTPVGCDLFPFHDKHRDRISIHAPQWGATRPNARFARWSPISIHAPQWGATRHGGAGRGVLAISIHAPQWGATPTRRLACPNG